MKRPTPTALVIDTLVASKHWRTVANVKAIVRQAVIQAAATTLSTTKAELAIVLTDDSAIRLLNRNWRGVDAATNVLSFPARAPGAGNNAGGKKHLGDIVLAFETIAREAQSERKPFAHHVAHLAVHGFLHLVGYDHQHDQEALAMERTERDILRQLAIPDPYRPNLRGESGAAGKRTGAKVRQKAVNVTAAKPAAGSGRRARQR